MALPRTLTLADDRAVTLRAATADDAPALLSFLTTITAHEEMIARSAHDPAPSVEAERKWIASFASRNNCLLLLASGPGGEIGGLLDFEGGRRRKTRHAGEFGISVQPAWRRHGLARALLEEMLAWARAGGVVKRIGLSVFATNAAARALFESFGFTREGTRPRAYHHEGAWVDEVLMGIWLGD